MASLARLDRLAGEDLLARRYARLRAIGTILEGEAAALQVGSPSLTERIGRLLGRPAGAARGELDDDLDEGGA
jgi:hypothetical protein